MKRTIGKMSFTAVLAIISIFLICLMCVLIKVRIEAQQTGEKIGDGIVSVVAKTVGTMEGLADAKEAYEQGKREGLEANDTHADVQNKMKELGKLEVMVASVKLNNLHEIGSGYSALYLLKGEAVFTVDLTNAVFEFIDDELYITLEPPIVELIINERNVEKVAEWQEHYFKGSAEDGFDAYLNTMEKITEASEESISNYASLLESAKESAEKQILQLANTVAVKERAVYVKFE